MKLLIFVAISVLLFRSCGGETIDPKSVEGRLVASITKNCEDSKVCTIRLRDATNFDWDKVYVFKYTATRDEIARVIGFPLPRYEEFKRKIVFLNAGKLAYSEADPTDIEGLINEEVVFDIPDNESYRTFSSNAVFEVTKVSFPRGVYYQLKSVR